MLLQPGDRTGGPEWVSESREHVLWSTGEMAAIGPAGWLCWQKGGKRQIADTEKGKSAELGDSLAKRVRWKEKETSKGSFMVCKIGSVMIPFIKIKNILLNTYSGLRTLFSFCVVVVLSQVCRTVLIPYIMMLGAFYHLNLTIPYHHHHPQKLL